MVVANNISPAVYESKPVPPNAAVTVAPCQVPEATVPKVEVPVTASMVVVALTTIISCIAWLLATRLPDILRFPVKKALPECSM